VSLHLPQHQENCYLYAMLIWFMKLSSSLCTTKVDTPFFVNNASFKNGKHKSQVSKNLKEIYAV